MTYRSLAADTLSYSAGGGDQGELYYARPTAPGKYPGVVLIHHMPGWDDWSMEATRVLAHNGFAAACPHLYFRFGNGSPDDLAAKARAEGGVHDDIVMSDVAATIEFLKNKPEHNGKIGVIGFCSGGRHTYIAACKVKGIDAAVDCWGGNMVPGDPSRITATKPFLGIEFTADLSCPLLGLFGNDDPNPTPADVDVIEAALQEHNKDYDFHRYDDAAHAFFNSHRTAYRPEQALDGWDKVYAFFNKHLA